MKISFISDNDLTQVYRFVEKAFPQRPKPVKILDFWFSKNQREFESSIILKGENNRIWGQILASSMIFYFESIKYHANWIFDYIVHEEKRKDGYGIDLLQFALQNRSAPIFGTGSGSLALKIELKMGFKLIGEIRKYVGIGNPFFLTTSVLRGVVSQNKYPTIVKYKTKTFKLTSVEQLPEYSNSFNSQLLEFGRDKDFLKWRFFSDLHQYTFYKQDNGDDYFIVRTIVKKGFTCLVLVDYRCDFTDENNFVMILRSLKKVASKLKLSIIIAGSSLKMTDEIFETNKFKSIGRPRPIITTDKYKEFKEQIKNREFVLATMADSDGEITW